MINPEDYPNTLRMNPGESIKVPHLGCSESKAMKVTEQTEGTMYKCFKCGAFTFNNAFNSPRERLRRQVIYEATMRIKADVSYELPVDFSQTLPPEGLAWVGQGGWTIEMMAKYRIGWSQELNRVILPVGVQGYTARSVHAWLKPKYLEMVPRGTMWESLHLSKGVNLSRCVIVEDILSAGRCGEFMKSYALLGTSLDTKLLMQFNVYSIVYIWLDNDKGGTSGLKGMINRLKLVTKVKVIRSDSDPKSYTDKDIRRYLCVT